MHNGPHSSFEGQASHGHWPLWQALAIVAIGWLALGWPWLSGSVAIPWDAKAHFQPQISFLAQSLHRGESPFWNPYVFAGQPQIADPQSLIFSPPYLLLALLVPDPGLRAADATLLAALLAGAIAIVLLFQDRGWHPAGAVLAALAFAYGCSAAWRIQHVGQVLSLAYWPIAWLLLERALQRRSMLYGIAAGCVAGFLVLGRDQVAYLAVWHLTGLVAWHVLAGEGRWPRLRAALPPLMGGLVAGLLVAGPPIVLTALFQAESNRTIIDLEGAGRGSLHPALLVTAIAPNLFGADGPLMQHWGPPSPIWGDIELYLARNMGQLYLGILPLVLLAGVGIGAGRLASRAVRWPALFLALMLLYALGRYTPVFALLFETVPGIGFFRRPADAAFLIGGIAAFLAGYALHRLLTDDALPLKRILAVAGLVIAGGLLAGVLIAQAKGQFPYASAHLAQAAIATALALVAIVLLRRWRGAPPILLTGIVALVMVADLALHNGPNDSTALPSAEYDVLRPDSANATIAALRQRMVADGDRRDRVELAGIGFHWPNASMTHRLDHVLGYNPVRLRHYSQATGAQDHVALPDQRRFAPLMPSYRSPLADMLGLRFVATGVPAQEIDRSLGEGDLVPLGRTKDAFLYENPRALPRVFVATNWRGVNSDALIETGRWPDGFDPRRETLIDESSPMPALPAPGEPERVSARILDYRNTSVTIAVEAPQGGVLVLRDVWHPWWTVEVDGRPAPMLRVDAIFRGVTLPPGARQVRFVFRPFSGALADLRRLAGR